MTGKYPNSLGYVSEKLSTGIFFMAVGEGTPQSRLADAWIGGIGLLSKEDIPPSQRDRWEEIYKAVTAVEDEEVGRYRASCRLMDYSQVRHIVDMLFCIWSEVDEELAKVRG